MNTTSAIRRCRYLALVLIGASLAVAAAEPTRVQAASGQPAVSSEAESPPVGSARGPAARDDGAVAVEKATEAEPASPPPAQPAEPASDRPSAAAAQEAEAAAAAKDRPTFPWYVLLVILFVVIPLPFLVANSLAKSLRMPDHAWKIGLSLSTVFAAIAITVFGWPPQLGPDLSGGVNLIYELDPEAEETTEAVDMSRLIAAISERVNPGGVKEVTIRQYGTQQVEIIIPRAEVAEIDLVKRKISTAGSLEFRITANTDDHEEIIVLAQAQRAKGARKVVRGDQVVARWVRLNAKEFDPARDTHLVTRENERREWEVLVVMDPWDVTGEYLVSSTRGVDERGRPAVNFTFDRFGAQRFGRLTRANLPNKATNFYRYLGIVLDDELRTAPRLNDVITQHGQISGNFDQEEVEFIISILNAGSLPAALNERPIKEDIVSATLGADTVRHGSQAIAISMLAVLLFMIVYYRFAGVVACFALLANLVLILAVMILIKAAFTLPGLAGLVLTVGMAVDANVLIFERIREELGHGAAMRMAIRNGFTRATRTIVDANLTTLITALVLYWIGTDQIRGFAVTLILGILMSMYTAIFCSRIVFDIAERKRWITDLKMMRFFGQTNIDFLKKRHVAGAISVAVIFLGLVAVVSRGKGLLDIDFMGGTSVTIELKKGQALDIAEVRKAVTDKQGLEDVAVVGVGAEDLQHRINTRNRDIDQVEARLQSIFGDRLRTHSLEFSAPEPIGGEAASAADKEAAALTATDPYAGGSSVTLTAGETDKDAVKRDTLVESIEAALRAANQTGIVFDVQNPDYLPGSEARYRTWHLKIALDPDRTKSLLTSVQQKLAETPIFPSSSNIGGKVAGDTQAQAGYALFASLLFIVGYIWMRFQRIMFGLAAVVALVHDVLITLGVLAASGYLVTYVSPLATLLLLDPFKISLPIVAAFLTIIGYSLNDTIVVFDRIREVRGKSPELTAEMVNTSINQTLGRTLLTSLTTLLVVVILYLLGGAGIHGFAFALVIGVLVGTYSSIFVASPALLWMSRSGRPARRRRARAQPAQAGG